MKVKVTPSFLLPVLMIAGFFNAALAQNATDDSPSTTPAAAPTETPQPTPVPAAATTTIAPASDPVPNVETTPPGNETADVTEEPMSSNDTASNSTEPQATTPPPSEHNNDDNNGDSGTQQHGTTAYGVTTQCHEIFQNCTMDHASDMMENMDYCGGAKASLNCTAEPQVNENNETVSCTDQETSRLQMLYCGPGELLQMNINATDVVKVNNKCLARMTTCLALLTDVGKLGNTKTLQQLFCDNADDTKKCTSEEQDGAVCTMDEYKSFDKAAQCNSCALVTGSAFLSALVLLVHLALSKL